MRALNVFSLSLKYLKDHCLGVMQDRGILKDPKDVSFVVTIPVMWSDCSKEFMRFAAIEVNMFRAHCFYPQRLSKMPMV